MIKIIINYFTNEIQIKNYELYKYTNRYDNEFMLKSNDDDATHFLRFKFTRGLQTIENALSKSWVLIGFEDNYDLLNFIQENDIQQSSFEIEEYLIKSIKKEK